MGNRTSELPEKDNKLMKNEKKKRREKEKFLLRSSSELSHIGEEILEICSLGFGEMCF